MTDDNLNSPLNSGSGSEPNSAPNSEPERAAPPTTPNAAVSAPPSPACDRVRPELKAYLDGQIGWWRQRAIRAHVAQCAVCREEREAMRDFSDNLRSADAETLDPALRAKILAAVPHTPPAVANVRPAQRRRQRPLLLAGAAASAALVGAALYPALTSHSVPVAESASFPSSAQQEVNTAKTAKTAQTPAAGATRSATDVASMNTNGVDSVSADGAFHAPVKAEERSFARSTPAPPAPGASSESAKSPPDKPIAAPAAPMASAPIPRPSSVAGMSGNTSDKSSAKSIQDAAHTDTLPVAPSTITVQVRDVETRSADVEQKALAAGGKIVQSGLATDTDKTLSATLTLKIPAARLEGFLTQVAGLGRLQSPRPTPEPAPMEDAAKVGSYAPKVVVKSKANTTRRQQATLVPVTVNLKSSG